MSFTALAWCCAFLWLIFKTTQRPIWAVGLYLITFYAQPNFWWWGKGALESLSDRWSLIASLILLAAYFANFHLISRDRLSRTAFVLLGLYIVDAFFVNLLFASNPIRSNENFTLLWKQGLLCFLTRYVILDRKDLQLLLAFILLGSAYIGYEVVLNDAGRMVKGRLEINCAPDASDSNTVAALLLMALPIGGYFLLSSVPWYFRIGAFLSVPLVLDTILRCNSRGAFLATGMMGLWILALSPGKVRRRALLLVTLGGVAVFAQAKDANIWARFDTTFASAEERDASAESRIEFWKAALRLISDHPLGSGGEAAFASDLGMTYISQLGWTQFRAVHNGYLDIASGWGVQGFAVYVALLIWVSFGLFRRSKAIAKGGNVDDAFLAVTIQAMLIGQLSTAMFVSTLDCEWFFWIVAISLAFVDVTAHEQNSEDEEAEIASSERDRGEAEVHSIGAR